MAGVTKESRICPGLTFYLFNLYCVGEIVQLNFLLLGRDCIFFFYIKDDQSFAKSSYK